MRRFGLLGYPLTHSFSQRYFTEKFQQLGLADHVYQNFSLPDISQLNAVFQQYPDLEGFNITIPYKKQVLDFLDDASDVVQQTGACNCVHITNGKRTGHNTDVVGFRQSLLPFLQPWHRKALVLGTGGASAAVDYVLDELGIAYRHVSRTASVETLGYNQITPLILEEFTLIINTTPLGMYPETDASPPILYDALTERHHLYDLIYNPAETLFLRQGKEQGATVQNGEEMLVLQAEESWRIWNS
jgi:shikimate dehydrogenase